MGVNRAKFGFGFRGIFANGWFPILLWVAVYFGCDIFSSPRLANLVSLKSGAVLPAVLVYRQKIIWARVGCAVDLSLRSYSAFVHKFGLSSVLGFGVFLQSVGF